MDPQIDTSNLDDDEKSALRNWPFMEVINLYNQDNDKKRAIQRLDGLMQAIPLIRDQKPPLGPTNEKEHDLLGRVLATVAHAYSVLNGSNWKI